MIQVINRALDILEIISANPEKPRSLGDIADNLGLNHGTCANIIKTLVSRKYLEQVGTKKGYVLGSRAYTLSGNDAYRKDLIEMSAPEMEKLTALINENSLLAILNGENRIVIHRISAEQELQVRTAEEKHVYDSASGRLLLAMLPDIDIERFIAKYGLPSELVWKEAHSPEGLMEAIGKIRAERCALQVLPGRQVIGLAVAIQKNSKVVASLSIYLPEYRYMNMDKIALVEKLKSTADRISQKLKH
ncbi:IclR family transcriptional regulator [Dyadobacter sp. CY323]|uniref:IclR family transcriptional regulator n=1 Tax=Dyadobacter sp. CY323 TaxID=2907302 RepID=UPI001F2ABCF6|nr:IclR family transcriptional regulator [Dyadobacter sp. CY323]MCE6991272.1 IclR family transcriptional regulator [Dyadobacter sp. CY323]